MSFELFPIQLPTSPEAYSRPPLLFLFDGSGYAYECTRLLPLNRLVYGVFIDVPEFISEKGDRRDVIKDEIMEYLEREFGTIDTYFDKIMKLLEQELFDFGETAGSDTSEESAGFVPSLHLGGFSSGGFIALELARRLLSPSPSSGPRARVLSVILFDTYNPCDPRMRVHLVKAVSFPESVKPHFPEEFKYPLDHPLAQFSLTHSLHFAKLLTKWEMQPLAAKTVVEGAIPPVHYLRAVPAVGDDELPPSGVFPGYWTEKLLPTLDLERMKVLKDTAHLEIWKPENIGQLTEWVSTVLTISES